MICDSNICSYIISLFPYAVVWNRAWLRDHPSMRLIQHLGPNTLLSPCEATLGLMPLKLNAVSPPRSAAACMQLPALNVGLHGALYSRKATLSTAVGIVDSGPNKEKVSCRTLLCLFCACTSRCWPCSEFCVHHCAVCPLVPEHIGGWTCLKLFVCCNWGGTEKNAVPYVRPNNPKTGGTWFKAVLLFQIPNKTIKTRGQKCKLCFLP